MGFNTTVVIMNDALHTIANDPDFGKRLEQAIQASGLTKQVDVAAHGKNGGIHCNAATVIETHHADGTAIVAVGGNCGTLLGSTYGYRHHLPEDKLRIIQHLASQLGYDLRKKPKRRK